MKKAFTLATKTSQNSIKFQIIYVTLYINRQRWSETDLEMYLTDAESTAVWCLYLLNASVNCHKQFIIIPNTTLNLFYSLQHSS